MYYFSPARIRTSLSGMAKIKGIVSKTIKPEDIKTTVKPSDIGYEETLGGAYGGVKPDPRYGMEFFSLGNRQGEKTIILEKAQQIYLIFDNDEIKIRFYTGKC